MENRLKDERGNRRERENRANGGERYDRSENMQQGEFPSNNDGQDGGNHDEPMYDNFGGQGMHGGPPFPSDITPPPVLMPVPGAGYAVHSTVPDLHTEVISCFFIAVLPQFIFFILCFFFFLIAVLLGLLFLLHLKLQCKC